MKLMHLADLHLGKRVNGFSMLEDQQYILQQVLQLADEHRPDGMLLAGDIYDRSIPSEEAVQLLDEFLYAMSKRGIQVYMISGNHDSEERVAFGGRLMEAQGIHVSPVYSGTIQPVLQKDAYGTVAFWLIPFLKPVHVKRYYPDVDSNDYTGAMQMVIDNLEMDPSMRHVALVHQFLTGASTCDSEEQSVGGLDQIAAEVFAPFDYVALGHLHGPQAILRPTVRYAGSPLKYSFSEVNQKKSVTLITLGEKGDVDIALLPLTPRREMLRKTGFFAELTAIGMQEDAYCELTLLDEDDVPDAMNRLRVYYPNAMLLRYDNTRTRTQTAFLDAEDVDHKTPLELFDELYDKQNGQHLNDEQKEYLTELIQQIWEGEV